MPAKVVALEFVKGLGVPPKRVAVEFLKKTPESKHKKFARILAEKRHGRK